jgi:oligogalacturonide transporter
MTDDYKLRTVLSGSRMVISAAGTTLVFFILFMLKQANNPDAYLYAGVAYTIVFVVGMAISWRLTWERPLTQEVIDEIESEPKLSVMQILKDYGSTFRVKAFRKHLTVYLFSFTGKDFFQVVMPTFVVYSLLLSDSDPWLINAMAFVGIAASILAAFLMVKVGPKFLFTSAYSFVFVTLIGFAVIEFLDIHDRAVVLPIIIVLAIVWHIGRQVLEFTPWNVFPFIPDVDHIMTRESRAGIYAAVMTFFRKSTGALATWIAGILLELIHFKAAPSKVCSLDTDVNNLVFSAKEACENAGGKWAAPKSDMIHAYAVNLFNTEPSIEHGITFIMIGGTGILILIALIVAQSFRLDRHTHGILKEEIHRLEAGGSKADVSEEAKRVCEALTGHHYEALWPDMPGDFKPSPSKK